MCPSYQHQDMEKKDSAIFDLFEHKILYQMEH